MATYAGKDSSFYSATGGKPVEGAWYSGQRYMGGKLLAPGQYEPGKQTSNEVIQQTNPNNVAYIQQQQQTQAQDLQAPVNISLPSGQPTPSTASIQGQVDQARNTLDTTLKQRKEETDKKLAELRVKEQETLDQAKVLATPFREELEKTRSESLYVNKNFEENQKLVDELEQLLTEGNDLIRQQQEVTGLGAVRNPRIQKTMEDVNARAGVISAVINSRNGQIAQAQNIIDREIGAIVADRQDQLSYYQTVLELNRQDILSLDEDSKNLAGEQLNLLKNDLDRANATADKVRDLLLDPQMATLMAQAGVSLNDSVEQISAKMSNAQYTNEVRELSNQMETQGAEVVYDPKSIPSSQLVVQTDSRGVKHYYKAQPGTFGVDKPSGGGGGTVSERNEINRRNDFVKAEQFIQDNPNATAEEITAAIRANTSLSSGDIKILLQGGGVKSSADILSDAQLKAVASQLLQGKSREEAMQIARQGKLKSGNKVITLSSREIEKLVSYIESSPGGFFEQASSFLGNLFK